MSASGKQCKLGKKAKPKMSNYNNEWIIKDPVFKLVPYA